MSRTPASLLAYSALLSTLALVGCGGGNGISDTPAPTPAPPPAPAPPPPPPAPAPPPASTTVSGSVVKGPVSGAQVCAYLVVANARGTGVGSCVTTDASGNYVLTLPLGSGPLWVEATGGTYTDEATATTATLPVGSALRALVTANGGNVSTMLTPLTTLALNAAAFNAASGGTLDAAAFSAATTQLLAAFNLPSTLNISTTQPTFGASINSYGLALTAISRMVVNGSTLASILAATQPSTLAAAYATAANPPPPAPPAPPPAPAPGPGPSGAVTTSGSLTSDNAAVPTFTPTASADLNGGRAFTTAVGPARQIYTFINSLRLPDATGTTSGIGFQSHIFTVNRDGATSVAYYESSYDRGIIRRLARSCNAPCAGLSKAPTANGKGIVFTMANVTFVTDVSFSTVANPSTTPVVLNGSIRGEIDGGYVFASQLPRATTGSFSVDGVTQTTLYAEVGYAFPNETLPEQFPGVVLYTAGDELKVSVVPNGATPVYSAEWSNQALGRYRAIVTPAAIEAVTGGYRITLNAQALASTSRTPPSVTVTASVVVGRPGGSVTVAGEADFKVASAVLAGANDELQFDFRGAMPASASTQPSVMVTLRNGAVVNFLSTTASGKLFTCDNVGSMFRAKCSGTVTLSADQRSLTFTGFTAARDLTTTPGVAFNGTLTAAGL